MLATASRAAPRAARRALTTGSVTRAPVAPPYEHAIRPSLAPPYAQQLPASDDRLKPTYSYQLRSERVTAPSPAEWVAGVLATDAGRAWAQSAWDEAIAELAEQPAKTPEISFQALTAVLADASMRALLQRSGGVVVRDVVRDALAEAWAAELISVRDARTPPHATFHHEAQVAARADCSVLSATGQLLRALVPGAGESFIRVDSVTPTPAAPAWTGKSLWDVDAIAPATPLHAHLALARTELALPTSSAAATYALLRPHFAAKASRISFYSSADYLSASNWAMREGAPDANAEHHHVRPATAALAPGDVLVSHAGLTLTAADKAGLVLPVHPLPATEGNKAFVALQRAAFEAGLPPPHVTADLVALEPAGNAQWIESHAGRRAMGYDA